MTTPILQTATHDHAGQPRQQPLSRPDLIWLAHPGIHLPYVAGRLYGQISRLHTRRLQDKLKGRSTLHSWEETRLQELKQEIACQLWPDQPGPGQSE